MVKTLMYIVYVVFALGFSSKAQALSFPSERFESSPTTWTNDATAHPGRFYLAPYGKSVRLSAKGRVADIRRQRGGATQITIDYGGDVTAVYDRFKPIRRLTVGKVLAADTKIGRIAERTGRKVNHHAEARLYLALSVRGEWRDPNSLSDLLHHRTAAPIRIASLVMPKPAPFEPPTKVEPPPKPKEEEPRTRPAPHKHEQQKLTPPPPSVPKRGRVRIRFVFPFPTRIAPKTSAEKFDGDRTDLPKEGGVGIRKHNATDYPTAIGTLVGSPITGMVERMVLWENERKGGRYVAVTDGGYTARVFHLQDIISTLKVGEWVNAGDVLGRAGRSGNKHSPTHIHVDVRKCEGKTCVWVDPQALLRDAPIVPIVVPNGAPFVAQTAQGSRRFYTAPMASTLPTSSNDLSPFSICKTHPL